MPFNSNNSKITTTSIIIYSVIILAFSAIIYSCATDPEIINWYNPDEYAAGGATTLYEATSAAFSTPAPNLSASAFQKHMEGDVTFEATFVTAPAPNNAGLGPIFNDVSCVNCHTLDGRGDKPSVFRLSIPGTDEHGGPNPAPGFGGQLQDKAVFGTLAEGNVTTTYIEEFYSYPDGTTYSLLRPIYTIDNTYMPLPPGTMLSVRAAPPVFGLGLLEAINSFDIIASADENDNNQDGISGKVNFVYDVVSGTNQVGRFGWKANQPHLDQQTAGAFSGDMGITTPLFPQESCSGQVQDDGLGDDPEVDAVFLDVTAFYTKTLAVPAPRNLDNPQVQKGKQLFFEIGCENCHRQKWTTGVLADIPEVSNQTIYPYTDMLLHDMGPDLADNRPDYLANGYEWKTRPLWGIGLTALANGHTRFLHDARARNLEEAILWHGGEAQKSTDAFKNLSATERANLIKFLEAL
jgi:CxxC motif-containing protein (DUF1111 family)